jgi:hypothetical protein
MRYAKWAGVVSAMLLLSACGGGGSTPPAAGFTATFSPTELTLTASSAKQLKASNQITITTSKSITNPVITLADDAQTGKAQYFSISGCSAVSSTATACNVNDTDPTTEQVNLKVMVSDGSTTVQATPEGSSAGSNDIVIHTTAPTPPPAPSTPCSFAPGAAKPCAYPSRTNSAWLYDGSMACTGTDISVLKNGVDPEDLIDPSATCSISMTKGANAPAILAFNQALNATHSNSDLGLNEVNVYAGDVEFGNDDSTISPLKEFELKVMNGDKEAVYDGSQNIQAYHDALSGHGVSKVMAVIDGRHDALGVPNGWLWQSNTYNNSLISHNFNNLNPADAVTFADHIAEQFCDGTDPAAAEVSGIQFDLESFHLPDDSETLPAVCDPDDATFDPTNTACTGLKGWGQYLFYREMSKDLAGYNTTDPLLKDGAANNVCAKATPKYFTLFDFPNTATEHHLATMLNSYNNGYAIFSLYDLGGTSALVSPARKYNGEDISVNTARAGFVAGSEPYYKAQVGLEINQIKQQVKDAPIHFQVGIPGAASAHEFSYSESPAYDTGKVDDRYASAEPAKEGDPIYPDCATANQPLAATTGGCATDATLAATYQAGIVIDAMSATKSLLEDTTITPYYIGLNLWSFNPSNVSPTTGQVLANNHWIPRASQQDSALSFPAAANVPVGPDGTQITDQNKYVVCDASYSTVPGGVKSDYIDGTVEGGCSGTYAGYGNAAAPFTDDGSYSHTPDQYIGMRFYYPNSIGVGDLTGSSADIDSENTQEQNVVIALKAFPDLMSITATKH